MWFLVRMAFWLSVVSLLSSDLLIQVNKIKNLEPYDVGCPYFRAQAQHYLDLHQGPQRELGGFDPQVKGGRMHLTCRKT